MIDVEKYRWSDHKKNMKEADDIRKDCSTARGIINDALARYVKKKIGARNKRQAEDMALMFKDLEDYESEKDIQDAYGWEFISEKEKDRLIDLWKKREQYVSASGKFEDRVTAMVKRAMDAIGEEYIDFLTETAAAEEIAKKREREIVQQKIAFEYERYRRELKTDATDA